MSSTMMYISGRIRGRLVKMGCLSMLEKFAARVSHSVLIHHLFIQLVNTQLVHTFCAPDIVQALKLSCILEETKNKLSK